MITMQNWHVCVPDESRHIGYKKDNLAHRLIILTDAPADWMFKLDVQHGSEKNVIDLLRDGDALYVDLTREMLLKDGQHAWQVRGMFGDIVQHSNVFYLYVSGSINASHAFPDPLPIEFEQLEKRVTDIRDEAEGYALNPPIIAANGNWLVYSDGGYVDSGYSAQGLSPYIGRNGNWWIGDVDTGAYASGGSVQAITNMELEAMLI